MQAYLKPLQSVTLCAGPFPTCPTLFPCPPPPPTPLPFKPRRPPPSPAPLSYKPQKISPKFEGSVRALLHKKIRESYLHPQVRELPEPSDEKAM